MTRHAFPSPSHPPFPPIALDAPDGWSKVPAPASLISIAEPAADDRFRANVVVSASRVSSGYDIGRASALLTERTSSLPEAEVVSTSTGRHQGRDSVAHEVAFRHESGITLIQTHLLVLVPGEEHVDVIHVVGTIDGRRVDEDLEPMRSIVSSLAITLDDP